MEFQRQRNNNLKIRKINKSSERISFLSLVKNCNHKGLGIYYLLSAFIFGISATLISVLIRIELYSTGNRIISPENQNSRNKGYPNEFLMINAYKISSSSSFFFFPLFHSNLIFADSFSLEIKKPKKY